MGGGLGGGLRVLLQEVKGRKERRENSLDMIRY